MEWKKNILKAKLFGNIHTLVKQLTKCPKCKPKILQHIMDQQKKGAQLTPEAVEEELKPFICDECNEVIKECTTKTYEKLSEYQEDNKP